MTGKEMCETIVRASKLIDPNCNITPEDVWNMSPTGELHFIFDLYERAKEILDPSYKSPTLTELLNKEFGIEIVP